MKIPFKRITHLICSRHLCTVWPRQIWQQMSVMTDLRAAVASQPRGSPWALRLMATHYLLLPMARSSLARHRPIQMLTVREAEISAADRDKRDLTFDRLDCCTNGRKSVNLWGRIAAAASNHIEVELFMSLGHFSSSFDLSLVCMVPCSFKCPHVSLIQLLIQEVSVTYGKMNIWCIKDTFD